MIRDHMPLHLPTVGFAYIVQRLWLTEPLTVSDTLPSFSRPPYTLMSVPPTPSKIARPVPFTPKRPLSSVASFDDVARALPPRATTPSALPSTRKFKASLSAETRPRATSLRPGSPKKLATDGPPSRPKTPTTPRRGAPSPAPTVVSEMDVSRIDPEAALVDFETVEAGDVSLDLDESSLRDYGREDKVLVSIR